jgi:hypothetical protein
MSNHEEKTVKIINKAGPAGFTFFLMYIGAAIYFIQKTTGGFWEVILGLLQAAVWPVYVIYHVLKALGV